MGEDGESVLIVGGGPVGLSLACELHRHGVRCRIVERKTERDVWSKAAAIMPRTLEVLRDMGVVDRFLDLGTSLYGARFQSGDKRIGNLDFSMSGSPFSYFLGLPQRESEELLEAHLERAGGRLERGVELASFEDRGDTVDVELRHLDDGRTESLTVAYLVGCDGAHSTVRTQLDLPFEGSTFQGRILQADVHVDFPMEVDPHEGQMYVSENGAMGFLPLLGEGRYRLIMPAPPDDVGDELTLPIFQRLVDERSGNVRVHLHDPAWMVAFRFHGRIVPHYSVGRVFLAGDAAHIHSPVGAQGMNLGIQDAYNLAWKLSLVLRGAARPQLLDSYSAERRAIGAQIVRTTDLASRGGFRAMSLRSPVAAAVRNQMMGLVTSSGLIMERAFRRIGGLDVGYAKSPIVGQFHRSIFLSNVNEDRSTEEPDLRDWLHFGRGPGPGERVPELPLSEERSLFDLLGGTRHVLLLFDGAAATEAGYDNLASIGRRVRERYPALVDIQYVVPTGDRPQGLPEDAAILADPDFALHEHFGSGSESLYLVRPDGYVAYRSQPADEAHLFEYLQRIFV